MTTTIRPVAEWSETLDEHRTWVHGWIADETVAAGFDVDWRIKLNTVVSVAQHLGSGDVAAWQALGVVFGDALALATGLPWGEVTDEYGTAPGIVANAAMNAVIFPLTILSKRVEQGEVPDREMIEDLFQQTATAATSLASGKPPPTQ